MNNVIAYKHDFITRNVTSSSCNESFYVHVSKNNFCTEEPLRHHKNCHFWRKNAKIKKFAQDNVITSELL